MGQELLWEDLLTFPCPFIFRVIAPASPTLREDCIVRVEEAMGRAAEASSVQPSREGKWCSVRVEVTIQSADEIRAAYALLGQIPGIRMIL